MGKRELDSCAEGGQNVAGTRFAAGDEPDLTEEPLTAAPLARVLREWLEDVGPSGAGVLDSGESSYRALVELCKLTETLASSSNPFPTVARSKVYEKVTSLVSGGGEERKVVNQRAIDKWLASRATGLRRYPAVVALGWMPKLEFERFTGGRGKAAQFRITYEHLEVQPVRAPEVLAEAGPIDQRSQESEPNQSVPGLITYESTEPTLSFLGRLMFGTGVVPLRSVRGVFIIGSALSSALGALVLGLLAVLGIALAGPAGSEKTMLIAIGALVEAALIWHFGARPWYVLVSDRIKMAEDLWITLSQREAQIELLRREGRRSVRLVQYRSTCSVCGSPVHVEPGKREFHHRLVGRCAESPREHVFSFDRVTKVGYPLRQAPSGYRV